MPEKKLFHILISLFLFVGIFSCKSKPGTVESFTQDMPKWVYHYDPGNKTCGVGTSLPHIKGIAFQRAVAIARGIDEIARQIHVSVDSKLEHYMSSSNGTTSSTLSTFSVQTTSGVSISAKIIDAWLSHTSNEFYVLMCTD